MIRSEFLAVGTTCSAAVYGLEASAAKPPTPGRKFAPRSATRGRGAARALAAAEAEVAACERALSRFLPDSDLSRLNAADGDWLPVDVRLREALVLALRARDATNGRFDPTILPALVAAGYDRSFELLAERAPLRADGWRAGAAIEVEGDRARIERGAAVDLGGIGKGYAAQRAVGAMREAWPGLRGAIVDLGGDLAVWGSPPQPGPWRIGIDDPRGGSAGTLAFAGGGIATSGRDVRRFGPKRSLHHLIDPRTGAPAEPGPLAVTVVARSAGEAEAHATALAISTFDDAAAHVAATPGLAALWIPEHGPVVPLGPLPLVGTSVVLRAS